MECAGIIHEILPRLDNPAFCRQQEEGLPDGNPSLLADSIACPGNLPDRHGALVPDRLPTDAAGEQGRDADRNIGEHEQRECEGE